jgi:hypothetical protein
MDFYNELKRGSARSPGELSALPDEAVISAGEAAILLGKSVETLRRWRHRGIGPDYLKAAARPDCAEYLMGSLRTWEAARSVAIACGFREGARNA